MLTPTILQCQGHYEVLCVQWIINRHWEKGCIHPCGRLVWFALGSNMPWTIGVCYMYIKILLDVDNFFLTQNFIDVCSCRDRVRTTSNVVSDVYSVMFMERFCKADLAEMDRQKQAEDKIDNTNNTLSHSRNGSVTGGVVTLTI